METRANVSAVRAVAGAAPSASAFESNLRTALNLNAQSDRFVTRRPLATSDDQWPTADYTRPLSAAFTPNRDADAVSPLAAAFEKWHGWAAKERHLHDTIIKFRRSSTVSSAPEVFAERSWAQRDATLRKGAQPVDESPDTQSQTSSSLDSANAMKSPPPLPRGVTPFYPSVKEMPDELLKHKEYKNIRCLLAAPVDHTDLRWCRRMLYTEDNWNEWAEWQPSDKNHRDQFVCGRLFQDHDYILCAPDLRSSNVEDQADEWNQYRRHLGSSLQQALTVGCQWKEILKRLHSTYSNDEGYPRLVNYVKNALRDPVLLRYPLLHADILIFKLDMSYQSGCSKYADDSNTADWEGTLARLPGEDLITLAIRVISAYLVMYESTGMTDAALWASESDRRRVNDRYQQCMENDPSNPKLGNFLAAEFAMLRGMLGLKLQHDEAVPSDLSCERLAEMNLVTAEKGYYIRNPPHDLAPAPGEEQQWSGRTGAGCKDRRLARRADARAAETAAARGLMPPTAYMPDHLHGDRQP